MHFSSAIWIDIEIWIAGHKMKRAKSFVCLRVCFIVPKKSEMCQHRLIAPDCFHPCKCLAIIRIVFFFFFIWHSSWQQFLCFLVVNFSRVPFPAFSGIKLNDLPVACLLKQHGKEIIIKKKILSRGLSSLAGVQSIALLEGGMLCFHLSR